VDSDAVRAWVRDYVEAWRTNDPARIESLFAADAVYFTEPHAEGWRGASQIVANWLERKDEPGSWTFEWELVAVQDDVAVLRGETRYSEPPLTYSNVWLIRFAADGRCREFTEWWMTDPRRGDASPVS
jgi:uncharacterized protein (TIGR02246 family)